MVDVIETARSDLARINEKRARLRAELDNADRQAQKIEAFLEMYTHYAGTDASTPRQRRFGGFGVRPEQREKTRQIAPGSQGEILEKIAVDFITSKGRHARIAELLQAAVDAGQKIEGKRPTTNLSSVLSRSDRVIYEHPHGWTLYKGRSEASGAEANSASDSPAVEPYDVGA